MWPIARKVFGVVPLLTAIWCLSYPAPGVWQVQMEDLGEDYRERMGYVGGEYSKAGLDEFVRHETRASRTSVSGEAWEAIFQQAESTGSGQGDYLYLPADTEPLREWVNSDRPGYSVELPGKYPRFLWVHLYSTHSAMFNDDVSWGMTHPYAWLGPWLAGLGVLSYSLVPWYRRRENEAVYHRARSMIGPDVIGVLLAGCFMALPLFILTQISTYPRPLDFATSGAWFCLVFWLIAAIGAASFVISAWYEGLRFAITPEGITKISLTGSREFAFSQMIEVKPMCIVLPRWLRTLAWLVVMFNWRLAGPLLLATPNTNHGLEIPCRDGRVLKVWAVHLLGYEQIREALKGAGLRFQESENEASLPNSPLPGPPRAASGQSCVCPQCNQSDKAVRARDYQDDPASGPPEAGPAPGTDADERAMKELERVELLEHIGRPEEPAATSVYPWVWVLFIPVVNVIAIWLAPLRRFHKGALAGMVAGVVTGFVVQRLEAIGVPYIIGTVALVYYCVALVAGKSSRERDYLNRALPEWRRLMSRWESLCHCFRCKVVWLDTPSAPGSAYVPVAQAKTLVESAPAGTGESEPVPVPIAAAGRDSFWPGVPVGLIVAAVIAGGLHAWLGSAPDAKPGEPSDAEIASVIGDLSKDAVRAGRDAPVSDSGEKIPPSRTAPPDTARVATLPRGHIVDMSGAPTWSDDFSAQSPTWKTRADAGAVREHKDGKLSITFLKDRGSAQLLSARRLRDFALQIEAAPVGNAKGCFYGVVVRQSDPQNFVTFVATPGGESIVLRMKEGKNELIAQPAATPGVGGNGTVTILVQCVGFRYVFSLNGNVVATRDIPGPAEGAIGVIAGKSTGAPPGPIRVMYDNLKVWDRR